MSNHMISEFVSDNAELATAVNLLDKWVAKRVHDRHQPSVALGIVHNGDLIWGKGYGYANLEQQIPVTLDSRFRIASISKTFTATSIMQLYDAGKLRLDEPISNYLDWFDLQYPDAPAITIYHCLTHTSGLPRDATIAHWTENHFQSWEEVVETTKTRQPIMPPLQDFSYSNLAYTMLGGVIEAVSGESWGDYVQNHILNPLGMSDTIPLPDGSESNLVIGYLPFDENHQRKAAPFVDSRAFSPSTSMASSVKDLVKYAKFHLSKGQTPILSAYSLRDMHRPHWIYENWQGGYGLGISSMRINDWTISGHNGAYKGFLTMFSVCREHDFAVITLTNALASDPFSYTERAYKLVLPEVIKITAKTQEPEPQWQKYVGSYANDWSDFEVVIRNGQLQTLVLDYIDMPPTVLEATDDPTVFINRVPGNPGGTSRFELDEDGNVLRLFTRNEYSYKK
jgi:CubicO group peptidase (beta-lactamase class C family)